MNEVVILASSIALVIVLLSLLMYYRTIVVPIRDLTKAAKRMAGGQLDIKIAVRSKDGIGQLAETLNTMSRRLNASYTTLEEKVRLRTEELEKSQALIRSEHSRLNDLLKSMSNGVIMFDQKQNIIIANPLIQEIFGRKNDDGTLSSILSQLQEGHKEAAKRTGKIDVKKAIEAVLTEGTPTSIPEVTLDERTFEVSIIPVRDDEKNVAGGAIILHDITHLKEVDTMKTEFVSLASHQLRTPLSAIRWFLEILKTGRAGKITDKQREVITDAHECSNRMMSLVNDLLNISRLDQGRIMIAPEPTDIVTLIEEVILENQSEIEKKHQTLVFKKPTEKFPTVNVDPQLMRQVFTNLLSNATKYNTEKGDITVELRLKDENFEWCITDTGCGIPKRAQEHLFQKFFRARNASTKNVGGTGLGLYLTKRILDQCEGTITVESEEDKGSTFCVSLPIAGCKAKEGDVRFEQAAHGNEFDNG